MKKTKNSALNSSKFTTIKGPKTKIKEALDKLKQVESQNEQITKHI